HANDGDVLAVPCVGLRGVVSSLVAFFIVVSTVSLLFDRGHESQVQLAVQHRHQEVKVAAAGRHEAQVQWTDELMGEAVRGSGEECNWSVGRWVYDNASQPLNSGLNCSFIFDEVACEKYGRNGDGSPMDVIFRGMSGFVTFTYMHVSLEK
uniref:Trichome birefringence-like N-terminal domain-containing protein n=1 Tax=Aegilops tauschii subsp. strangulata TaxID=200361 RepID=A0A453QYX7_AEGTS